MMQHGRARRPGRAHLGEEFEPVGRDGVERTVAQPVDVAQEDLARLQRLARTDDDAGPLGIEMHDIERLAGRDADAAPLADRVAQDAFMAAEHAAVDMDDVAGRGGGRLQLGDDVGIFALRHEADVLAVGLSATTSPISSAMARTCGLDMPPSGKRR